MDGGRIRYVGVLGRELGQAEMSGHLSRDLG
jgi:hypothetical protein